jgi:hypothetical protein
MAALSPAAKNQYLQRDRLEQIMSKRREAHLFLKKKMQKNFFKRGRAGFSAAGPD